MRKRMSLPEILLWSEVRAIGNSVHLRRQVPIAGLTVDFACLAARLVFEIDGKNFHDPHEDAWRDSLLQRCGYEVQRIAAEVVLKDPSGIAEEIIGICRERLQEKEG